MTNSFNFPHYFISVIAGAVVLIQEMPYPLLIMQSTWVTSSISHHILVFWFKCSLGKGGNCKVLLHFGTVELYFHCVMLQSHRTAVSYQM